MNEYYGIFKVIDSLDNIKTVLDEGWNINDFRPDSNYTLLNATCCINRSGEEMNECVKFLLDNGSDSSIVNYYGDTPLLSCCTNGINAKDAINLLLEAGSDPNHQNNEGNIPLTLTTNLDIIKLLIEYGSDINKKGKNNMTALHYNSYLGFDQRETIEYLISHGADINAMMDNGCTPIMLTSTHQLCFWRTNVASRSEERV